MESATLTRPRPGPVWLVRLRAVPESTWARVGLGLLCAVALVGFFLLPTYPTYDSYYALIWGRDILHGHLPNFQIYRAPTEHPLAIAFGVLVSVFGRAGDRLMILGSIGSFVALVAGLYRLGRLTFGPVVGVAAALLLCSRFDYMYLAAQGYLDFPYMALVVWAAVLEVARPRRGTSVFVLLALAGLLRPEAWLLSVLYLLWCAVPAGWAARARYAALTAAAPLLWLAVDAIVTGKPTYSLHSTTGLAEELGRTQGLVNIPGATWGFMVRLDKLPLVLGGIAGALVALLVAPRRLRVPLTLVIVGLATFGLLGAAGTSVIDRYLLLPAVLLLVFTAVALGGWSMLRPGSAMRRVWIAGALGLIAAGVIQAAGSLSVTSLRNELAFRNDSHRSLAAVLENPRVKGYVRRCGPLSFPNHKLLPDVRWVLDVGPGQVIPRSQARAQLRRGNATLADRLRRGVGIYPTADAVFRQAIVDLTDDPRDQVPPVGFSRELTSQYYAVYVRC